MLAIRRRARFTSVQAHDLKLSKLHRLRFGRELFRLFPCSMNSMNSMNAQPFPNPCGGMGSPSPASLRPLVDTQIVVPHRLLLGHSRHPGSASTAPGSPHGASLESSLSPDPAHDRSHSNGPACNSSVGASPADTSRPGHVHYTAPISASAVAGMVRGVLIIPPPSFPHFPPLLRDAWARSALSHGDGARCRSLRALRTRINLVPIYRYPAL